MALVLHAAIATMARVATTIQVLKVRPYAIAVIAMNAERASLDRWRWKRLTSEAKEPFQAFEAVKKGTEGR